MKFETRIVKKTDGLGKESYIAEGRYTICYIPLFWHRVDDEYEVNDFPNLSQARNRCNVLLKQHIVFGLKKLIQKEIIHHPEV